MIWALFATIMILVFVAVRAVTPYDKWSVTIMLVFVGTAVSLALWSLLFLPFIDIPVSRILSLN